MVTVILNFELLLEMGPSKQRQLVSSHMHYINTLSHFLCHVDDCQTLKALSTFVCAQLNTCMQITSSFLTTVR